MKFEQRAMLATLIVGAVAFFTTLPWEDSGLWIISSITLVVGFVGFIAIGD